MSGAADRSRIRKREDDEGTAEAAAGWNQLSAAERATHTQMAAAPTADSAADVSAVATGGMVTAAATVSRSSTTVADWQCVGGQVGGVQPLPEQMRKQQRLSCLLDSLAVVELQLVMQCLDAKSRVAAARCSPRLLHAASHSFAWKGAPPFVIEARTPAEVERIAPSLLRFAPIHLVCIGLHSLECVATIPLLYGFELHKSPSAVGVSLSWLLQQPCTQPLQWLCLDSSQSYSLLPVGTVRHIARLPQLHTLKMFMVDWQAEALLPPLADAPALTDLSLAWTVATSASSALLGAMAGIEGLRRLSISSLTSWRNNTFRSFFTSPNIRQLQHLELGRFSVSPSELFASLAPTAAEYAAAFSAMQQLQSLTLHSVWGINQLLPHLRHTPSLRLLSIRLRSEKMGARYNNTDHPSQSALAELLAAAPQLEVRLLLPSLERWLAMESSASAAIRSVYAEQWNQLHRMAEELERVGILYDESM